MLIVCSDNCKYHRCFSIICFINHNLYTHFSLESYKNEYQNTKSIKMGGPVLLHTHENVEKKL